MTDTTARERHAAKVRESAEYFCHRREKVLIEAIDGFGMVGWIRHVGDDELTVEREWHSWDKFPISNVRRMGTH